MRRVIGDLSWLMHLCPCCLPYSSPGLHSGARMVQSQWGNKFLPERANRQEKGRKQKLFLLDYMASSVPRQVPCPVLKSKSHSSHQLLTKPCQPQVRLLLLPLHVFTCRQVQELLFHSFYQQFSCLRCF